MAFHSLSKPHTVSARDRAGAQGHPHYWRDGRRRESIEKQTGYNPEYLPRTSESKSLPVKFMR